MSVTTSAQQVLRDGSADNGEIPERFWELLERYRGELVNQAFAILGDHQHAEDVVQESFCEAFCDPHSLAEVKSLGAWLRKINRNNALDRLRHQRRQAQGVDDRQKALRPRTVTTGGFSILETRELMAKAVENLPERMRSVVVMKYWEGLSYDEIGQRLKLPKSTVWRLYYEASQQIYSEIGSLFEGTPKTLVDSPIPTEEGGQP